MDKDLFLMTSTNATVLALLVEHLIPDDDEGNAWRDKAEEQVLRSMQSLSKAFEAAVAEEFHNIVGDGAVAAALGGALDTHLAKEHEEFEGALARNKEVIANILRKPEAL